MRPTQFGFDALLKHPPADSHLEFHRAPCHDSKVLFLHSRGHTLLMWCWLASLTCCGGREPYMPLQEDRSLRQCWRWTAPASGKCHHSLQKEKNTVQAIEFVLWHKRYGLWSIREKETDQESKYWAHTNDKWTLKNCHIHTHPPTICISIKRPMLLSVNVSVWAWDRDKADTGRAQWHVLTEVW